MPISEDKINQFFEWAQILSALISLMGAPWAAAKLFSFLKPHVVVAYSTNWLDHEKSRLEWNVKLKNKTRKSGGIQISLLPLRQDTRIVSFSTDLERNIFLEVENRISNGRAILDVNFWPKRTDIYLKIKLNQPEYIECVCDNFKIKTEFPDDYLKNYKPRHHFIFLTKVRVLWMVSNFVMISLICISRLVWLGLVHT